MDGMTEPKTKPSHAIDMTSIILNMDGEVERDGFNQTDDTPRKNWPPLTLGAAVHHALLIKWPDERDLPWDRQFARGLRAQELRNNPAAEIEFRRADHDQNAAGQDVLARRNSWS